MKPSAADLDSIALGLLQRHGLDPRGSVTLRARLEQALTEVAEPTTLRDEPFLDALAERLRVGETRFYRDPGQSDALAAEVVPRALAAGRCRILSAGCSTGQEAFTLAMIVADACAEVTAPGSAREPSWDVLGMDVSATSIQVARRARYPKEVSALLPGHLRRFVQARGDEIEVDPAIASRCQFVVADLLTAPLPGPFHLVLCRNVLIYLSDEAATRVLHRLSNALAREGDTTKDSPPGLLVVARAEVPLARRAGLLPVELGSPPIVAFARPGPRAGPPSSRRRSHPPRPSGPPSVPAPPSRLRLVVSPDDDASAISSRGQHLLQSGVALIEIQLSPEVRPPASQPVAIALRRFVAAARAVGARCVASTETSSRALVLLGVRVDED